MEAVEQYLAEEKIKAAKRYEHAGNCLKRIRDREARENPEKAIASSIPEKAVPSSSIKADAKRSTKPKESKKTIALPSTTISTQVEATEPGEATETTRPPCPKCGKTATVQSHGIRENKDGSSSHRWRCKPCKKSWSVAIAVPSND